MDILSLINNSISLINHLKDISKNTRELEFKNILFELYNEMANLKLSIVDMKEEIIKLKNENLELKQQKQPKIKPKIKYGCYYFDNDMRRLYCTSCFDSKGVMSLTQRDGTKFRKCNVCNSKITN